MRVALVSEKPADQGEDLAGLVNALGHRGHDVVVSHTGRALRTAWSDDPPDVVHTHSARFDSAVLAVARKGQVPILQTFQRPTPPTLPSWAVATCDADARALARMGLPRRRITVIPWGVDTTHFVPEGPAERPEYARRVVSLGPVTSESGHVDTVAALRVVPDTEFVVVTDSPAGTLSRFAREMGVADRVRLVDRYAHEDLPTLLRSADAVVCAPWVEARWHPALEAMACGVPVVATTVGCLADMVIDGISGVLVPPRKVRDLAAALRRFTGDGVLREQFGASARDRACARYSWDRVAAEHERAYDAALADHRPAEHSTSG